MDNATWQQSRVYAWLTFLLAQYLLADFFFSDLIILYKGSVFILACELK